MLPVGPTEPVGQAGDTNLGVRLRSASVVRKGPKKVLVLYRVLCCVGCTVPSAVWGGHWPGGHVASEDAVFLLAHSRHGSVTFLRTSATERSDWWRWRKLREGESKVGASLCHSWYFTGFSP